MRALQPEPEPEQVCVTPVIKQTRACGHGLSDTMAIISSPAPNNYTDMNMKWYIHPAAHTCNACRREIPIYCIIGMKPRMPPCQHDVKVTLQMSQRPSKVSLDKAAAEARPLPLAGTAPSTDKDASASGGADLALIWTLEGPEGQPSRAGATHFYDVKEKVIS